jgi:hypothetical protein
MKAIDIACRVCAQQPGELCMKPDAYGSLYVSQIFHAERVEDAAAISEPPMAVDPKLVDAAFEAVADEIA